MNQTASLLVFYASVYRYGGVSEVLMCSRWRTENARHW